jgi:aminopeptidase N
MHRFEEVERPRLFPSSIRKLDTVLPNEWTFFQFLEQTQTPESPVSVSHQRFADVMTRKDFFFEKDYLAPFAREDAGNGAPRGSTTHYYDVESICIHA